MITTGTKSLSPWAILLYLTGMTEETCKKEVKVETGGDVEELRAVLGAVSEFLKDLTPMLKNLLETLFSSLKGEELGKETGLFYKNLIDAGIDKDTATHLTEQFLRTKMDQLGAITNVVKAFSQAPPIKKEVEIVEKKE